MLVMATRSVAAASILIPIVPLFDTECNAAGGRKCHSTWWLGVVVGSPSPRAEAFSRSELHAVLLYGSRHVPGAARKVDQVYLELGVERNVD